MSTCIIVAEVGNVGVISLNRPQVLNALSSTLIDELLAALKSFDKDPRVGAIVLTGDDRAFCAGADIKEQKELGFVGAYNTDYLKNLNDGIFAIHKPIIGAINGYALGGGCELAMMCDILYAGENAVFGQPEIKLGTIPWSRRDSAAEAAGLVAKVFAVGQTLRAAIETGQQIASYSAPVVAMAKEAVNEAEELGLKSGLHFESRLYHSTFGMADHAEGFDAFLTKRQPQWVHK
ncbi:ClpP/crotonase-like domain-containing protein [Phlebopus sp. FC_14]|nr:ClpP/crotonase-like domain-containing protein [Phlebopus sp. FC_14]